MKVEVHARDSEGDPIEPSLGTVRPSPATDGTGEGLPMRSHRSGGKSKVEAPKQRVETPTPEQRTRLCGRRQRQYGPKTRNGPLVGLKSGPAEHRRCRRTKSESTLRVRTSIGIS